MQLRAMSACSMQEISGISGDGSPEKTLSQFCTQLWGTTNKRTYAQVNLYSFYIFSAAVPTKEGVKGEKLYEVGGRLYGDELANYIRENNLGDLTETIPKVNSKFHPSHSNKVWVWNPDFDAVTKWWGEHTPKPKPAFEVPKVDWDEGDQLDYGDDDDEVELAYEDEYDSGWDDEDFGDDDF